MKTKLNQYKISPKWILAALRKRIRMGISSNHRLRSDLRPGSRFLCHRNQPLFARTNFLNKWWVGPKSSIQTCMLHFKRGTTCSRGRCRWWWTHRIWLGKGSTLDSSIQPCSHQILCFSIWVQRRCSSNKPDSRYNSAAKWTLIQCKPNKSLNKLLNTNKCWMTVCS